MSWDPHNRDELMKLMRPTDKWPEGGYWSEPREVWATPPLVYAQPVGRVERFVIRITNGRVSRSHHRRCTGLVRHRHVMGWVIWP